MTAAVLLDQRHDVGNSAIGVGKDFGRSEFEKGPRKVVAARALQRGSAGRKNRRNAIPVELIECPLLQGVDRESVLLRVADRESALDHLRVSRPDPNPTSTTG